jgi:hypothetical protein
VGRGTFLHRLAPRSRCVQAIKSAIACPDNAVVADAFETAVERQRAQEILAARRQQEEEVDAAQRRRREAALDGLKVGLAALMASDSEMYLPDAVEFVTPDAADRRLALYRSFKNSEHDTRTGRVPQSAMVTSDLVILKRRAVAEGFLD